jgi:hypothetical protein
MTSTQQLLHSSSVAASEPTFTAATVWLKQVGDKAHHLGARIVEALDAYAESRADAALYEELSKLSEAELGRRGIPRGELHRCVFRT